MKRNGVVAISLLLLLGPLALLPMNVSGRIRAENPFIFGELYKRSEIIVRATAVKYAKVPGNPNIITTGIPDSIVGFKVEEVLRGKDVPENIQSSGYLKRLLHPTLYHLHDLTPHNLYSHSN